LITAKKIEKLIQELTVNDHKEAREWLDGKGEPEEPREAINELVRIGKPALKPLLRLLKNTTKFSCIYAIMVLGEMRDPIVAKPLINLWDDEKFSGVFDDYAGGSYIPGCKRVIIALQKIGSPALQSILSYLEEQKKKGDKDGTIFALATLSKIKDERSYMALVTALSYPDDEVQYWAIDSLVVYGDKRALKHMRKLLKAPNWTSEDDKKLLKQFIKDLAESG
jgi:hypothetical protein